MTEVQQYLFDLQGYIVIEDVLSGDELAVLNELFDQQGLPPPGKTSRFGAAPDGAGFLQWGQPLCDLLDHPDIMPVLRFRLGDCFRLDRLYGMYMRQGMGRGGLHSDYGASARTSAVEPGEYYHPRDNEIVDGFIVVAWSLTDAGPGRGGFCCIPGSHKSHFRLPQTIHDAPEEASCLVTPNAPAGSVILFTESLTHATAAWRAGHERRTLLYKYCVSHIAWTSRRVQPPTNTELTARQQILLREPADPHVHFPSLFEGPS
ncbi:MAG: phytanoyl-CoA dioxygenase family protein [Candidatus Latescibacterota bacterium]|mgnify:FL=1